ncbi:MAG: hypothetical protein JWN75_551 [Candidatus Saccharibacteria bacterium]|nr:hypothetical protein [Candidatus Saccharibacteria bacterium]
MQSQLPPNSLRKQRGLGSFISVAVLIGLSLFVRINYQDIADALRFWAYQPPTAVSSIVSRSGLSDAGTFALYSSQPSIEGNQTFNDKCGRQEQNTAILGCYTNGRIYIYDVTDARLDGIKEVTAAHEMLHAIYQRLSGDEKTSVDKLVEEEYTKLSSDPAFSERMAFYARTEPGERDNELHSIIGTEVSTISPDLEAHYAKYFTDRSKILTLFNNYNGAFTSLDTQAKSLQTQLDSLGDQIKTDSDKYNVDVKSLNAAIADFNKRAADGSFTSQAAFTNERASLQRQVESVTNERDAINSKIVQFEKLRTQYNDTVTQTHDLYKSIDSNLSPAPKV